MSTTELGRWLEGPCRTCNSDLTSLTHPAHLDLLESIPIFDRVSCVLGHCNRHRNLLPAALRDIYQANLNGRWSDLTRVLDAKAAPNAMMDSQFPRQDAALVNVDHIDNHLKKWGDAWSASNLKVVNSQISAINVKLDCLGPSSRDFQDNPGYCHVFDGMGEGYCFLGKLVRIVHRLQDTVIVYQERRPHWTFTVTKYVKLLITKIMFIIRDVLWKDGHITVRNSPSPPVPCRPQDKNKQTPPSPVQISEAGTSSANENDKQSASGSSSNKQATPEEHPVRKFSPINKPRSSPEQRSDTLIEGSHSSRSSAGRPKSSSSAGPSSSNTPSEASEIPRPSPSSTRSAAAKVKRERERAKGEGIIRDGLEATNLCERCAKSHKTCMVAKDPAESGTFKCGHCIKGQLGCSLSALKPGRDDYDDEHRKRCITKEENKKAFRAKTQDAMDLIPPKVPVVVGAAAKKRKLQELERERENAELQLQQDNAQQAGGRGGRPPRSLDDSTMEPPPKRSGPRTPLPSARPRRASHSSKNR